MRQMICANVFSRDGEPIKSCWWPILSHCQYYRPEHFARPTSGTIHFYLRTCPFYLEQVPRTCKAISQHLLTSGQSMTYQFVSMFRKESIPFIRSTFGEINPCKNENDFNIMVIFSPVKWGRTWHSPRRTCPLHFKQVSGLRVCWKICSGLNIRWILYILADKFCR